MYAINASQGKNSISTTIDESIIKSSDVTRWIRESIIENVPSNRMFQRTTTIKPSSITKVVEDTSNIYEIPSVDETTFEIIWKNKFMADDDGVVEVVIKRLQFKRNIFKVSQLECLVSNLFQRNRFYYIHNLYLVYKKYFGSIHSKINDDTDKYRTLIKYFIQVESQLNHYTECEELFSQYIKLSRMESRIVNLGLKSFVANNNIQLAKEFFIQIMKDNDNIFPLEPHDFKIFLKFLQHSYQYELIDYFIQMWVQFGKPLNYELLSYFHYIYLMNSNLMNDKLERFTMKQGKIFESEYFDSLQYKIITFYCDSIRQGNVNIKTKQCLDGLITKEPNPKVRYWYYKNMLKLFVQLQDLKSIQEYLHKMINDSEITLNSKIYNLISNYFVKRGDLKNLVTFYDTLLRDGTINLGSDIFYLILRCGKIAYPDGNFQILVNQLKKIMANSHLDMKLLWWLTNFEKKLKLFDEKDRMQVKSNQLYLNFINKIRGNRLVEARNLLYQYFQNETKQDQHLFYRMLKYCLSCNNSLQLAEIIDKRIRQDDYYYKKNPLKLEILWLSYHIKYKTGGDSNVNRARLQQLERNFDLQMSSQNCLDLANLMLLVHDYSNAERLIKKSCGRIINDDKLQWTIYYMISLKFATRTLNPAYFVTTLQEWVNSPCPVVLLSKNKNQIQSYIKYFDTRSEQLKEDIILTPWQNNVTILFNQLKARDEERQNKAKQDIQSMVDSMQQWIDRAVLENHSYNSKPKT
ncbi:protein Pet111p, mitochondrial [Monosporozyma servazzii]